MVRRYARPTERRSGGTGGFSKVALGHLGASWASGLNSLLPIPSAEPDQPFLSNRHHKQLPSPPHLARFSTHDLFAIFRAISGGRE
jgi:hypothetical protein